MYLPSQFKEDRAEVLHGLVHDHPLGTLVTSGAQGLEANHIPFLIDPEPAPLGTLRAHVARANPVWREFSGEADVLVIFQGAQLYVTPAWYPTKRETGKVVPTWNYLAVHAYGRVRAIEDKEWLRGFVSRLTDRFEAGRADPWKITDAPSDYIDQMLTAIVGLEIPVSRLLGKWKVSQNRTAVDRAGVVRGLKEAGGATADTMAQLLEATLGDAKRAP